MAVDKKSGYPTIPEANWLALRGKLKQKVPTEINISYLASALTMSESSAGANVLPALRSFGLLDKDGKPSELAFDWRDDSKYKNVCEKIIKSTYPQELQDLYHDSSTTLDGLKDWFMRSAKVGDSAAKKFARTYLMLLKADLTKVKESVNLNRKDKTSAAKAVKPAKGISKSAKNITGVTAADEDVDLPSTFNPNLHIDIQIHISPESNADQIDKIFESMAKHLKGFKS